MSDFFFFSFTYLLEEAERINQGSRQGKEGKKEREEINTHPRI